VCCVPDPARTESEEQNYGKLVRIHPDKQFPALAELPANLSRFRK
jgi:hypothetical protein